MIWPIVILLEKMVSLLLIVSSAATIIASNTIDLILVKEYIVTFNRPELLDRLVLKEESFDLENDIGKRKEV